MKQAARAFALHVALLVVLTLGEFLSFPALYIDSGFFPGKDEAWHLQNAVRFHRVLFAEPERHTLDELFHASVYYPPLAYVASAVAEAIAESESHAAILGGLLPFLALLNFSLYALGRRVFNSPAAGIWAACLVPLIPLQERLYGVYELNVALAGWCPLLLLLLADARSLRRPGRVLPFFAAWGLAFLTYVWAVMLVWLPALVFFAGSFLDRHGSPRRKAILLCAGLLVFGAVAASYAAWPDVRTWFIQRTALHLHPESTELHAVWREIGGRWFYLRTIPETWGVPLSLLAAWGLLRLDRRRPAEFAVPLAVVGTVAALSLFANVYRDRVYPLAGLVALLAAVGLVRTVPFLRRWSVLVVICAAVLLARLPTLALRQTGGIAPDLRLAAHALEHECARGGAFRPVAFDDMLRRTIDYFRTTDPSLPCLRSFASPGFLLPESARGGYSHFLFFGDPERAVDGGFDPTGGATRAFAEFTSQRARFRRVFEDDLAPPDARVTIWRDSATLQAEGS